MERVSRVTAQLAVPAPAGGRPRTEGRASLHQPLKWNGWGFHDTHFVLNDQGQVELTGTRYLYSGTVMPAFRHWIEQTLSISVQHTAPEPQTKLVLPPSNITHTPLLKALCKHTIELSISDIDRIDHCHGHSGEEIYELRYGHFQRYPDIVVFPETDTQVQQIINQAHKYNAVIIPFGGGTNVTQALIIPPQENRIVISMDMRKMNKILWVDHHSMQACIQAGASGPQIEAALNSRGLCLGHEPDSFEFSTLGGWISTRASGMKKNRYGNIEDIVLQIKTITPVGVIEKPCHGPRLSTGPDVYHLIMGSEGMLGVITQAVVKVQRLPEVQKYGSYIFPEFQSGVECLHEIAMKKCQPASIRLVDNTQFSFGNALKPQNESWIDDLKDAVKHKVLVDVLKFDPDQLVVATIVFEGSEEEVSTQRAQVDKIAKSYGGFYAGENNGKRGFFLTYVIAYLRDLAFKYQVISESFETSVPWKNVHILCIRVKERIVRSCKEHGFLIEPFTSCRVTQVYDTGACVYFYFGVPWKGVEDYNTAFAAVERDARDEVLSWGGSLSHHHGIGKLRSRWVEQEVSSAGVTAIKAVKQALDPTNIFACGNIIG